ncbi:hypothetical protein Tfer_0873 [Thermincola ferriacetica]|uniref:Uncharacterized protein n=1 Tax=Thermincola ferriacetica TaxID=281456 RepID=A0A0L6W4J1_9FIRM|nr:hypothetical protein Tfer_0873 [Thermincola ferriacetica]
MAHKDWCGEDCSICKTSCGLDEAIPCSPDCDNLGPNGETNSEECQNCDAFEVIHNFTSKHNFLNI